MDTPDDRTDKLPVSRPGGPGDIAPPGYTDAPADAKPAAATPASSSGGPNKVLIGVGAVVVAAAIGVGCYFIGHSAADAQGAADRGNAAGQAEVKASYAPGQPAYKAIYDDGFAAGQTKGRAQGVAAGTSRGLAKGQQVGLQEGVKQGTVTGTKAGAAQALGNFGSWDTSALYIVNVDANSQSDVPVVIASRRQMQPNVLYELCPDDPANLCSRTAPPTG